MDFSQSLDLSFQDKYILAFEREDFPFHSHLVLEFTGTLETERLQKTLQSYIKQENYLRLVPNFKTGKFDLSPYDDNKVNNSFKLVRGSSFKEELSNPFNFDQSYAFRILYLEEEKKLVFTHHHSLFDGHAQFNFLKDFLDIYRGDNYQARDLNNVYKFRKYFAAFGLSFFIKYFFELIRNKFNRKKIQQRKKIARLIDNDPINRKVNYQILEVPRKLIDQGARKNALSSSAYISLKASIAAHNLLLDKNDTESPMVIYIPKSMRFELKLMRHFQNLLGFIWMKVDRSSILNAHFDKEFRDTYKFRSTDEEVNKTLFLSALIVKITAFKKLKKIIRHKEEKIFDCTLLISSGRTPKEIQFPEEWKIQKLYALGSMTRSPGIGILSASYGEYDFITIEYLESAFNSETIEKFIRYFKDELGL